MTDRPEDAATVIARSIKRSYPARGAVKAHASAAAVLVALSEQSYSVTRDLELIRDAEKLLAQFDDEMSLTGDEFEVLTRLRQALGEV